MNEFMTELFPWLLIIASLTVFSIVNAKEKSDSEKKPHKFINGLCVMLSTTAFLFIVYRAEMGFMDLHWLWDSSRSWRISLWRS